MLAIHLVCDAISAACLGCYGSEWVDTSHLDRLAQDGFTFDHCFVPLDLRPGGWRGPSLDANASRWREAGVRCVLIRPAGATGDAAELEVVETASPDQTALSDVFALASAWVGNWVSEHPGENAIVWIELRMRGATWTPSRQRLARHLEDRQPVDLNGTIEGLRDEVVTEDEIDALRDTYAARIEELDAAIGGFLGVLRTLGAYDDSLIVFSADQGWPLGEHESIGHAIPSVHEERDHVPFILKSPGGRPSSRSPSLVTTTDLAPTLEAFFGVGQSASEADGGVNLLPLVAGEPVATRDYIIEGFDGVEVAIRTLRWKLILPLAPADPVRSRMLFEKPDDRWEFNDLAELRIDVADHLELQIRRHLDALQYGELDQVPPLRLDILFGPAE